MIGGDDDVASQCNLESTAQRNAIDHGDDGLGHFPARDDVMGLSFHRSQWGQFLLGLMGYRGPFFQIGTC